jgi:hypothetical protein
VAVLPLQCALHVGERDAQAALQFVKPAKIAFQVGEELVTLLAQPARVAPKVRIRWLGVPARYHGCPAMHRDGGVYTVSLSR